MAILDVLVELGPLKILGLLVAATVSGEASFICSSESDSYADHRITFTCSFWYGSASFRSSFTSFHTISTRMVCASTPHPVSVSRLKSLQDYRDANVFSACLQRHTPTSG